MPTQLPAFGFGFLGTVFALLGLFGLFRGRIRETDNVVHYRSSDPFAYWVLVLGSLFLASIMLGGSIYYFRHPGTIPITQSDSDD
jgi:hypothetical protein